MYPGSCRISAINPNLDATDQHRLGRVRRHDALHPSLRSCEVLVGLAAYADMPDLPTAAD